MPSDPRGRLRLLCGGFIALAAVIMGRIVALECSYGDAYRAQAARLPQRQVPDPAPRGRLLARDGTVLARDEQSLALAVHYRYLEQPPDRGWLRSMARAELPRHERGDVQRLAAAQREVLQRREQLHANLAELCGLSRAELAGRAAAVQARVERIAAAVNAARRDPRAQAAIGPARGAERPPAFWRRAADWLARVLTPPSGLPTVVTVAEEVDYHVLVESLPLAAVAAIESHPQQFPGVRITTSVRRVYPHGSLAAHLLGQVARGSPSAGLERQYDALLKGRDGAVVEQLDAAGRVVAARRQQPPQPGRDLLLSLDHRLQFSAERLLDQALLRRERRGDGTPAAAGGAIVAMDVHSGAVLAAASAPRYDPNQLVRIDAQRWQRLLADPDKPLFDRVSSMALPPGSVFTLVTAAALVETGGLSPSDTFDCRGYLDVPSRHRCAAYAQRQAGHGQVTLDEALAHRCRVFFYHHARRLGPQPLLDWAERFGLGRATGIDLPGEAAALLPSTAGTTWHRDDTLAAAVGQGRLLATPLQMTRLAAAVAAGGRLVTPRLVWQVAGGDQPDHVRHPLPSAETGRGEAIAELSPTTVSALRRAMRAAVADNRLTAHHSVDWDKVPIAALAGSAAVGGGQPDHAWLVGYAPADRPSVAFCIVLEHAGDGSEAAGPVARRLVMRLSELGHLARGDLARRTAIP